MFCGFCDQPCDGEYYMQTQEILAYGQKGKLSTSVYYCDNACMKACIRNQLERNMRSIVQLSNDWTKGKKTKERFTYQLTIRSLAIYFKACFERKPKEELEILREQSKRMFAEAFCYETLIGEFSKANEAFLGDDLLEAWAK
jgi:hypothetical protein